MSINRCVDTYKFTINASTGALVLAIEPDNDNLVPRVEKIFKKLVVRTTEKTRETSDQALTVKVTDDD